METLVKIAGFICGMIFQGILLAIGFYCFIMFMGLFV